MQPLSIETHHIIDQVPGSIGIKSLDSTYLAGNAYFAKILGLNHSNDLIGRSDYELETVCHLADDYIRQDQQVIQSRSSFHSLQLRRCKDKPYRLFYSIKRPYYNQAGELVGVIGHGTNLNERLIRTLSQLLYPDRPNQIIEQNIELADQFRTPHYQLTKRESEVLFHLMRGHTAKQIAAILHLSVRTIDTHLTNLKLKFNCHHKSQLIEAGIASGLYQIIPMRIASDWLS